MKKIKLLALGTLLVLIFESCSKDKLEPNNSKKEPVQQQQQQTAPAQPETPTQPAPHPSCPHASTGGSAG